MAKRAPQQVEFAYKPFPIHEPFHKTTAREKLALGAFGSGKSTALVADVILHALEQPGSRLLLGRNQLKRLRDTTEPELVMLLQAYPEWYTKNPELYDKPPTTIWDFCKTSRDMGGYDTITLPNGSQIVLRALKNWEGLMSMNVAGLYIDEASEVTEDAYTNLITRVRQTKPTSGALRMGYTWDGPPRHTIALASNSKGHNWIWNLFVNPKTEQPSTGRVYFRSTTLDNPTLSKEYVDSLLARPKAWVDRNVYCKDDAFAGQILDFAPEDVVESFEPPKDWIRVMGLDWGLRSPTACGWWARNPDTGVWYKYREWQTYDPLDLEQKENYVTGTVPKVAAKIHELENGEDILWRAADPIIAVRQANDGRSIDYWFRKHGIHFRKGLKEYEPRINALNTMLQGQLKIMECCPMTVIAYSQYRWEDKNVGNSEIDPKEVPHKKNDHLVDADQYVATIMLPELKTISPKRRPGKHDAIWDAMRNKPKKNKYAASWAT